MNMAASYPGLDWTTARDTISIPNITHVLSTGKFESWPAKEPSYPYDTTRV